MTVLLINSMRLDSVYYCSNILLEYPCYPTRRVSRVKYGSGFVLAMGKEDISNCKLKMISGCRDHGIIL